MSAVDFPNSPTNGDTYTVGIDVYTYSNGSWLKNSNSPISKNTLTQKGDLITATSANTPVALPRGVDGQFLKVNSSTATGLQWATVPTISALDDVPDVTITSLATNDVLLWNGSAWVNSTALKNVTTYTIDSKAGSYTLVLTDANKLIEMNVATANNLTVPPNSSVAFATGAQIHLLQTGAGQTTVIGGSGVTVNGTPGVKLRAQWSYATLIKRASDTWVLVGDLAA